MLFLTRFSGGQGGQNLTLLAGSGGSKPNIFGESGVRAKIFFDSLRSPTRTPPPPPLVKCLIFTLVSSMKYEVRTVNRLTNVTLRILYCRT